MFPREWEKRFRTSRTGKSPYMYIYIYISSLKQARNISTFPFINLKNMPRVLPILSRPSNLLRRRKNIHWSPLLHHDTTFPVPRRITNSTVLRTRNATSLLLIVSPSIISPLVPHHSQTTLHPLHPRPMAVGVTGWAVTAARSAVGVARDSSSFSATFHRHHC